MSAVLTAAVSVPAFSQEEVEAARAVAAAQRRPLLDTLEESSRLEPSRFVARLAATVHLHAIDLPAMATLNPAFEVLAYTEAAKRNCVLFRAASPAWLLVLADPFDMALRDWVGQRVARPLEVRLAHREEIAAYLARHEIGLRAMDGIVSTTQSQAPDTGVEDISIRSISEDSSPVVRLVNSTLFDALRAGASDIHLESLPSGIYIKYRIDGVLARVGGAQGTENAEQVISRIKVMAELDIAERRVPQDGRFKVAASGREIDVRVSVMPSIHGEDAVLRILDKQRLSDTVTGLNLDVLGFDPGTLAALRRLSAEPHGMLLVTGPTGSGKTTTLYAAIGEINHGYDKIITIEDPVEYELAGVLQIPVNEKKGLSFARGLRSILRHDPDKIMVGEIRDGETAQIAVQAALTGHLVLTTVHANNVFDVLGRFTHMGVDPYSLVAALNGIVAQRLVRMNCLDCAQDEKPDSAVLLASGIDDPTGMRFRAGRGCVKCRSTGFKGRMAVAEVLVLDDELRELIVTREPVRRIKDAARAKGTRLMRDLGMELVRQGKTSLQELNRVVS
jgi:general secretion pathway protein E